MKYLLLIPFLFSCGNTVNIPKKIKTDNKASGTVTVSHDFNINIAAFKEACEQEHLNVVPQALKDTLIAECQARKLQEFLDIIANLQNQQQEGD